MKHIFITIFTLLLVSVGFGQTGAIRGVVYDENTGETMPFVNVVVTGTTTGATTDLDGNFAISNLSAGTYSISLSFVSYQTKTIEGILLEEGEIENITVQLSDKELEIEEVVIKAERNKNSDIAVLTLQKKSVNVLDGISSETFKKTGDGDAAAAIKRVTGVSVEGGKYVYVRGLGDRYTKTQLNGVDIPGLDPDRNTVQMDIFPSNLLDNLVIYKTFSPDLPGDFTGGMVNIETKSFPSAKTFSFSLGMGYTTGMHLKKDALRYKSGAGSFFAFGSKYRELPFDENTEVINIHIKDPALMTELTSSFENQLAPTTFRSPLNGSFSIYKGNQINKEKITLGYNAAFNYSYQFRHYDNYEFGRYRKDNEKDSTALVLDQSIDGQRSEQEVSWSGLVGGAIKTDKSKFVLNFLHSQNAVSRAAIYNIQNVGQNTALPLKQYVLDYSQRSVSNLYLSGKHNLKANLWEVEWKLSPTLSLIKEPDIRSTAYLIEKDAEGNDQFLVDNGDGAVPERFYRNLNEINAVAKADASYKFDVWNGEKSKLKFGFANTFKNRDYQIIHYLFENNMSTNWTGNGDELLSEENIFSSTNQQGTFFQQQEVQSNRYRATQNISAFYVMHELPIHKKFKAIYGLRFERTDNWITGYGRFEGEDRDEPKEGAKTLTENDPLPAVNLIYSINEEMNLRFSYSRTIARPSFKEKSFVSIIDPLSGIRFIGNIELEKTTIDNIDLRYENFFDRGEMFSVSAFYKRFQNPIEITGFELAPNDITPRNAGKAHVLGAEVEAKVGLGLEGLSLSTNITYIKSLLDMTEVIVGAGDDNVFGTADDRTEYESRSENLRNGEELKKHRDMFGQSPFIVNTALNYENDSIGLSANLSYNVQGKRLAVVGIGVRPDVYEQSFHSLNLKVSQQFGKNKRWKGSFSIQNLIGDQREKLYESYESDSQVFERYEVGRSFQLGFSYTMK
ncbi:MAG: TonB-dependent receptor domain-containing protein [Chitinophagales bacterium]